MIPYERFGKLRLGRFLPVEDIVRLDNWEFMDNLWVGEAVGFSEWLRLKDDPDILRSIAIDFAKFPPQAAAVLSEIGLPVRAGMELEHLRRLFGEPINQHRFVEDRVTFEFLTDEPHPYRVSCTLLDSGALIYLVVMVPIVGAVFD